jgi:restriction system protein
MPDSSIRGDQIKFMPNVYVVRAEFGDYTPHFLKGEYVGMGWLPKINLSRIRSIDEIYPIYKEEYPQDKNQLIIRQKVEQIACFLLEMKGGDFVMTPNNGTEAIHYGVIKASPSYYHFTEYDGCPFRHRRHVRWKEDIIKQNDFSVPFQHAIRSPLAVFRVSQKKNYLKMSGDKIWFE